MINPHFAEVAQRMPPLAFDPDLDTVWESDIDCQAYLDYYRINLTEENRKVRHGFGQLPAAGFQIATHYWLPEKPRGTLVLVHGYYDHVGLYGNAIRFGLAQGYAVLAFDLPGHGLSSGEYASIRSFDDYGDVLKEVTMASRHLLPRPFHCLGQSTGGATLLNCLFRHGPDFFDKVVLCAPLILPTAWRGARFLYWLARPWAKRVPRSFIESSHDEDFNYFLRHRDGLQYPYLPVTWVTAMRKWDAAFRGYPQSEKSVLLIQGTSDKTVDWRYNLTQIRRKLPNTTTHMIKGARHHLVNESRQYRDDLFAAAAGWLG